MSTHEVDPTGSLVEAPCRLSESLLWTLQRSYYQQRGVTAWNEGPVPHYVTNNSHIAWSYARVVRGFLSDLQRQGHDDSQPVYILELGAGAGRFGFLFVKHLTELVERRRLKIRFCYVMTDMVSKNLDFWRTHERLQPFYERGVLDLARFDAEHDSQLVLERSGAVLSAATLRNPLVVIGNYVFDTLTFDAFRIESGQLQECLVSLHSPRAEEPDLEDPELLLRLTTQYTHVPVEGDYYPDKPRHNQILRDYAAEMGDTSIPFPVGSFTCIDSLLAMGGGRLLLMSSDKAFCRPDELLWRNDPHPVLHGSFSLTANFEAMGRYVQAHGDALVLHSSTRQAGIQTTLLGRLPQVDDFVETRLEFTEAIDGFGPIDFFTFRESFEMTDSLSLKWCLDVIRLSQWDYRTFYDLTDIMLPKVTEAGDVLKRQLRLTLAQVWGSFYHIGESRDIPFSIARVLYRLEHYREALRFYQESLRLFGQHTTTWYNIGLCHHYLRERPQAMQALERSLELDPGNSASRSWLMQIRQDVVENPDVFAPVP